MKIFKALLLLVQSARVFGSPVTYSPEPQQVEDQSIKYWPYQSFETAPFHPPKFAIEKSGQPLADGMLFFAPGSANESAPEQPKQTSPMIMTDDGELVWSAQNGTFGSTFTTFSLKGKPVLSYWSGIELAGSNVGHFYGAVHILNSSYDTIYTVCPKLNLQAPPNVHSKCQLDGHEQEIRDDGTILFTAYNITRGDMSSIGGPKNAFVWDCLFYVYDIASEKELYRWSALDHVPISDTHQPLSPGVGENASNAFDYFHMNSVQTIGKDYFLVNGRHTFSTYLVKNNEKGDITWTISGNTGGDFGKLPAGGHFKWQHDVRIAIPIYNGSFDPAKDSFNYRMFNNNNAYQSPAYQLNLTHPSNGLVLHLTPPTKDKQGKAEFVSADKDSSDPLYSIAQGSNQPFTNGNRLLCFGFDAISKEFGPEGDTRMSIRFGKANDVQAYRMFRKSWIGRPKTLPSVAVHGSGKGYVSWNGATEVTSYAVYIGPKKDELQKLRSVTKSGFETSFNVDHTAKYVLVEAYEGQIPVKNSTIIQVGM